MKAIIALALLSLAFCNSITDQYEYLKGHVPYEIYTPEENPFRDWTEEEIKSLFQVALEYPFDYEGPQSNDGRNDLPEEYDTRKQIPDCTPKIRDQKKCGGCWAFAGSVTLSWRFCIASKGKYHVELSTQDSISCDENNLGCNGGYLPNVWKYYKETGLVTDTCFPFTSEKGTVEPCVTKCKNEEKWDKHQISDYRPYHGVKQVKTAIYEGGPVETGFTVYADFMNYKSGIYVKSSDEIKGGHAVIILGWGVEDGVAYWWAQNSWGTVWGMDGYFKFKQGQCGFDANVYGGTPVPRW